MIQLFMQQGHSLFVLKRKVNPRGVTMCAGLCPHNMNNTFTHTHAHMSAKQVGFFLFFLPPFRLSLTCWQGLPWWRALKDLRLKSAALLSWRRKWTISGRQADWTELLPPRLTPLYFFTSFSPPPPLLFRKLEHVQAQWWAQDVWEAGWSDLMVRGGIRMQKVRYIGKKTGHFTMCCSLKRASLEGTLWCCIDHMGIHHRSSKLNKLCHLTFLEREQSSRLVGRL